MRIYKTKSGILIEHQGEFYLETNENWDDFINADKLYQKAVERISSIRTLSQAHKLIEKEIVAPIGSQEQAEADGNAGDRQRQENRVSS